MIAHRVLAPVLAATVLAATVVTAGLLAGCTSPPPAVPPSTAQQPATVALPWPTGQGADLQRSVDGGSQPWLLDPTEVALAYAAAAHGWDAAQAVASTDGTVVDLTGPDGTRRTLTLTQPATPGPTGIWVVTTDTPTP